MNRRLSARLIALAAAAAITAWAESPDANGTISFVAKQMNVPIEGKFKKFSATLRFDPAHPTAGKAVVTIDMASVDLGAEDFNHEMGSKSWFDTRKYPQATFVSDAINVTGPNRMEVSGKLTIKGKVRDVKVPVMFKAEGSAQALEGVLPIRRSDFNIGEGEWRDTAVVADDVQIRFRLLATP